MRTKEPKSAARKSSKEMPESLKDLGNRVKAIRKELHFTQADLAEALDMSPSYISNIETGLSSPTTDFFFKIAKHLKVSLNFLILGEGGVLSDSQLRPSIGNKTVGESIESVNEFLWYIVRSPMMRQTMLGFASKFIHENEDYLKKEIAHYEKKNK